MTLAMTALFLAIASLAVSASVTTPVEMVALSGSAATVPTAETLTVRPSLSESAAIALPAWVRAAAATATANPRVLKIVIVVLAIPAAIEDR